MDKKHPSPRQARLLHGNFAAFLLLLVVAVLLLPGRNQADESPEEAATREGDACLECHSNVWQVVLTKTYIHKPFLEKKCVRCHIKVEEHPEHRNIPAQKEWFFRSPAWQSEYYLQLPENYSGHDLVLQFNDMGKDKYQQTIKGLVPERFVRHPQDQDPPEISNLQVSSIEQGLFLTAMVEWETSEPSDARVFYGFNAINQSSALITRPARHHRVQLSKLKKNRMYRFQAVSTDLSQNTGRSEIQQFSTRKTKRQASPVSPPAGKEALSFSHHFFELQEVLWLAIEANRPTRLSVGMVPLSHEAKAKQPARSETAPPSHQLKSVLATNNNVCTPCHSEYVRRGNHPINVSAPEGMHIPRDFVVLANGNIICMTCHAPHGSNSEFRLVKSSKQRLCLSCHHEKEK